jgi:hypothetical protein
LVHGALIGFRTVEFGRLMGGIIETVAKQSGLTPVTAANGGAAAADIPRAA